MSAQPTRIEPFSPTEMLLAFNATSATSPAIEEYAVPYLELRFFCPCASCVDEHTGARIIKKEAISPTIRATGVQLVGRYAVQINWSDRHSTGMYHYDRLYEISQKLGRKLN
jgi:DUF971 family protein